MKNIIFNLPRRFYIYIMFIILILSFLAISDLQSSPRTGESWKVRPTEHFLIYYEKNSPAAEDIETLASLLEGYFKETSQIFKAKITQKIPYYFHNRRLYSLNKPVWGYATLDDIHVVYSELQKDSSPHELRHFIHGRINPLAPYFFNEGACGLGIQIGGEGFHARAREICSDLDRYSLLGLVKNFQGYGRLGDYLAYSFNSFLIEQYGQDKFADFYKRVTSDNWQDLIKEIYGMSFIAIETKWKKFLCP